MSLTAQRLVRGNSNRPCNANCAITGDAVPPSWATANAKTNSVSVSAYTRNAMEVVERAACAAIKAMHRQNPRGSLTTIGQRILGRLLAVVTEYRGRLRSRDKLDEVFRLCGVGGRLDRCDYSQNHDLVLVAELNHHEFCSIDVRFE